MNATEYMSLFDAETDLEYSVRALVGAITGRCDGCGGCCGRVLPMTADERRRLVDHVHRHGVRPVATSHQMCALLDPVTWRCMAYAARPLVCRVWDSPANGEVVGTRPGQPCGCRRDRARELWRALSRDGIVGTTDTWEMFGLEEA